MKIRFKLYSVFCFLASHYYSQTNLVPNPSFEQYTACPNNVAQVSYATGWSIYANTPDYFNVCGTAGFSIPLNAFGYQYPANGNAYSGLLNYLNKSYIGSSNWREHIGRALSNTLVIGTKYFVSFKVVLTLDPIVPSNCASSKIGALFSTVPCSVSNPPPINNASKVYSSNLITDTLNWTRIFGSFVSDSAYKYIAIGNFFTDANTDTLIMSGSGACASYYYVDDICVSTDSIFTSNYFTGINEEVKRNFLIYPNPASNYLNINISYFESPCELTIYDNTGQILFHKKIEKEIETIDLTDFPNGILALKIFYNSKCTYYKLLKQ